MTERRLDDPASMVGATAAEVLALRPDGWLVRPLPPGREGFHLLSPDRLPGSSGIVSFFGNGSPGYRRFGSRPAAELFVLNAATEAPMLVQLLREWSEDDPARIATEIPLLARTTLHLARRGLIEIYSDDLISDVLVPVGDRRRKHALVDPQNWWRTEEETPATTVFSLSITERGKHRLAQC